MIWRLPTTPKASSQFPRQTTSAQPKGRHSSRLLFPPPRTCLPVLHVPDVFSFRAQLKFISKKGPLYALLHGVYHKIKLLITYQLHESITVSVLSTADHQNSKHSNENYPKRSIEKNFLMKRAFQQPKSSLIRVPKGKKTEKNI